jgi:thiamine-monophosphate kinase
MSEASLLAVMQGVLPGAADWMRQDTFVDETGQVFTTDLLVAGQHFDTAYMTPEDIGWRAGAVNLSDLAATGAVPRYVLVSLGLPEDDAAWVLGFYQGLQALLACHGGMVIGGDTVRAAVTVVNIAAIGQMAPGSQPGRRHLAQPGDWIVTTGFSGLSAVGLRALQASWPDLKAAKQAHRRPTPRLKAGQALAQHYPRLAMMDTSDGLADAALKLAEASHVCLQLEASALRVHPALAEAAARVEASVWPWLLYGGEDFELLATVPPPCDPAEAEWMASLDIYRVGQVVASTAGSPAAWVRYPDGREEVLGYEGTYQHF